MKAFDIYKRAMRLLGYGDILNDEALRQRFEEPERRADITGSGGSAHTGNFLFIR